MLADIKPGHFSGYSRRHFVRRGCRVTKGRNSRNVFIRLQKNDEEQVIYAERGALIKQVLGELQSPAMRLHLSNGNITKTFKGESRAEKIIFTEYDFPVLSGGEVPGFVTKDSMRSNAELRSVIAEGEKKVE